MFTLQYITSLMIPEEPERVHIQKCRIAAISQKVVDKFEDEDYDKYVDYASDEDDEDEAKRYSTEVDVEDSGRHTHHEDSRYSTADGCKTSTDGDAADHSMDPDCEDSEKGTLRRAKKGFYQPQLETKSSGWWNNLSQSFWLPSGQPNRPERRSLSLRFRKKKAYRTRVHHTVSDAVHLTPLDVLEYPYSENVERWTPPLTRDGVGRESELEILDLDI